MFAEEWSVLRLRFGLLVLSLYLVGSFAFREEDDSPICTSVFKYFQINHGLATSVLPATKLNCFSFDKDGKSQRISDVRYQCSQRPSCGHGSRGFWVRE